MGYVLSVCWCNSMGLCVRCVGSLVQDVSEDSRVRQGDSKALAPGLWDHYCLACYINCRTSQAEHKRYQVDLQIYSQTQVRWWRSLAAKSLILEILLGEHAVLTSFASPRSKVWEPWRSLLCSSWPFSPVSMITKYHSPFLKHEKMSTGMLKIKKKNSESC